MNAVVQQRNTAPPLLRHDPVLASRSLYAILGSGQSYTAIEIRPGRCPSAISAALSQWCSSSRAPSPVALRDWTGRRVQQPDHVEPIPQFGDRHHPGGAGHRPRTLGPADPCGSPQPVSMPILLTRWVPLRATGQRAFYHTNDPRPQR